MKYRSDHLKIIDKDTPAKLFGFSNSMPGLMHPSMTTDDVDDDFDV